MEFHKSLFLYAEKHPREFRRVPTTEVGPPILSRLTPNNDDAQTYMSTVGPRHVSSLYSQPISRGPILKSQDTEVNLRLSTTSPVRFGNFLHTRSRCAKPRRPRTGVGIRSHVVSRPLQLQNPLHSFNINGGSPPAVELTPLSPPSPTTFSGCGVSFSNRTVELAASTQLR